MKMTPEELEGAFERGVALLDEHHPGWPNKVDPKRISIGSCDNCVLGQLMGNGSGHNEGVKALIAASNYPFLDFMGWLQWQDKHGFHAWSIEDLDALAEMWRDTINERRDSSNEDISDGAREVQTI